MWVEYVSKGAPKLAYGEKLVDEKGTNYFVACGYYPDSTPEKVKDLVNAEIKKNIKELNLAGVTSLTQLPTSMDTPSSKSAG